MNDFDDSNEPVSSATHLVATLLSIAGLSLLVTLAALRGTATDVVGFSIFGATLVLLYLFSTLYHFLSKNHPAKNLFQIFDHIAIYILIAGTYTPLVLIVLPTAWGWSMFGAIWGLALCGVLIKVLRFNIPLWVPSVLYLLMGWLIVIALVPLKEALSFGGILWLLAGGIFYTVGTIFFALDNSLKLKKWYRSEEH